MSDTPDAPVICEVVITAGSADWLINFTRTLVTDRLAACGHDLQAIRSIYRWDGKIQDESEGRVNLHTRLSLVDRIVERTQRTIPTTSPGHRAPGRERQPRLHRLGAQRDGRSGWLTLASRCCSFLKVYLTVLCHLSVSSRTGSLGVSNHGRGNFATNGAPMTIVLIHGFWVTPRSWEDWIAYYEQKGYRVLAPAYPGFEVEVEALNADPSPVEALRVSDIVGSLEGA